MRLVNSGFADAGEGSRLRRRGGPRPDRRVAVERRLRVAATTSAVVAGLVLVGAGTGRTFFFDDDRERPPFDVEDALRRRLSDLGVPGRDGATGTGAELPRWLDAALIGLAALVVAAFVAAVLYGLYRGFRALRAYVASRVQAGWRPDDYHPGDTTDDDAQEEVRRRLRREFAAGGFELGEEREAREAVIACYQRMERTVAEAGTPRRPHETPEELLARVLAAHAVPRSSVERLTALYEEARYSHHVVDDDMRSAARRCLDDVRAGVGA